MTEIRKDAVTMGISSEKAKLLLQTNGKNELTATDKKSVMKIFAGQFKDIMVMILLIATAVSGLLGEISDAVTIIIIVLLNAALGFIQEYRTEKTLETLKNMTAPTAKVYRDGKLEQIKASEMVVGDIFEVEAGDRIPCDGLILSSKGFFADESILTGESVPAEKENAKERGEISVLNLPYVAYMGTVSTKGNARCQAFATGMNSQMGKVSTMIGEIEEGKTPLQIKLASLGKVVALICIAVCVVVFLAGILRGEELFTMLMTGITVAIAAIPEGLPATVTIALALAVRRMLKQKALVNKLHSVETLGCASVICSDKTGTITENRMCVSQIFTGENDFFVTGTGYRTFGEIKNEQDEIVELKGNSSLNELLVCSILCNNARISKEDISIKERNFKASMRKGTWIITGDPTEGALLIASEKGGLKNGIVNGENPRIDEIPFDSDTRSMTVLCKNKERGYTAYIKGSLDVILQKCNKILTKNGVVSLSNEIKVAIMRKNDQMAESGLRVLAFSKCETSNINDTKDMIFLGLIAMSDPPRVEAKKAIRKCMTAGIKTVMITGDHKLTAISVAKQAGIITKERNLAFTGSELAEMSDLELEKVIENVGVFARVNPADKLRIVRAFKKKGHIVAMTGDGVNDAPAIKEADIGVSMGETGTDVAKQAADLILLDDNFATLVLAVEEGRAVYANIRRFVRYLLSCNIGEVVTMFLGIIMGFPLVLLPTQLLLVNLLTDGLPAVALGLEKAEENSMKIPPRRGKDGFFSGGLMTTILFRGLFIGLCTLGCFSIFTSLDYSLNAARTGALLTLVISQLIHVFECKSQGRSIFSVNYFSNPFLIVSVIISLAVIISAVYLPIFQVIFSTVPVDLNGILVVLGCSFAVPLLQAIGRMIFGGKAM